VDVKEKEKPMRIPMSTCRIVVRDGHCSHDDSGMASVGVQAMVCLKFQPKCEVIEIGMIYSRAGFPFGAS
jgi:hypothetical protein